MCENQIIIKNVEGDFNNIKSQESNIDSIINIVIKEISMCDVEINYFDRSFPADVTKKIDHNLLRSKRRIILDYKSYSSHIEASYLLVEKNIINGKRTAMRLLNSMYCTALEKYNIDSFDPDINKVRDHADDIIEDIIKQLRKFIYNSANVCDFKEHIEVGINVVVAHAFVECYVLENPNHDTN